MKMNVISHTAPFLDMLLRRQNMILAGRLRFTEPDTLDARGCEVYAHNRVRQVQCSQSDPHAYNRAYTHAQHGLINP